MTTECSQAQPGPGFGLVVLLPARHLAGCIFLRGWPLWMGNSFGHVYFWTVCGRHMACWFGGLLPEWGAP